MILVLKQGTIKACSTSSFSIFAIIGQVCRNFTRDPDVDTPVPSSLTGFNDFTMETSSVSIRACILCENVKKKVKKSYVYRTYVATYLFLILMI